jgi:hypothetical protein
MRASHRRLRWPRMDGAHGRRDNRPTRSTTNVTTGDERPKSGLAGDLPSAINTRTVGRLTRLACADSRLNSSLFLSAAPSPLWCNRRVTHSLCASYLRHRDPRSITERHRVPRDEGTPRVETCWECETVTDQPVVATLQSAKRVTGTFTLCPACYRHCFLVLHIDEGDVTSSSPDRRAVYQPRGAP